MVVKPDVPPLHRMDSFDIEKTTFCVTGGKVTMDPPNAIHGPCNYYMIVLH